MFSHLKVTDQVLYSSPNFGKQDVKIVGTLIMFSSLICLSQEDELKKAILVVFANKQVRGNDFKPWLKWRMLRVVCRRKFEDFISET